MKYILRLFTLLIIIFLLILSGDLYCKNTELKKEIKQYEMKKFTCQTLLSDKVTRKIMCAR